jgi:uncharacterized protein YndB with AHSA1/START domain
MTRTPTGRLERVGDKLTLFVTRRFEAPIEDVWAAVTDPERMARWLGTWHGDPTTGQVKFRMGFEGDDASYEDMAIRECDPPRTLKVTSNVGPYVWYLDVALSEHDGVTTLAFSQPELDHDDSLSVGPGWEFYLDRLGLVVRIVRRCVTGGFEKRGKGGLDHGQLLAVSISRSNAPSIAAMPAALLQLPPAHLPRCSTGTTSDTFSPFTEGAPSRAPPARSRSTRLR